MMKSLKLILTKKRFFSNIKRFQKIVFSIKVNILIKSVILIPVNEIGKKKHIFLHFTNKVLKHSTQPRHLVNIAFYFSENKDKFTDGNFFTTRISAALFHFFLPVVVFDDRPCRVNHGLSRAGFFDSTHAYVLLIQEKHKCVFSCLSEQSIFM